MPYVVQRRRRYWARFQVPPDVRDQAFEGKSELWINLNTEDRRQAEARSHREASHFRARVLEARGREGSVEEDALRWRREIQAAGEHSDVIYGRAFREAAEKYVRGGYRAVEREARLHHPEDEHPDEALRALGGPKARTFVSIILGQAVPLAPFVAPWLSVRATEVDGRSVHMDGAALRRFIETFPLLSDVNRPAVSAWIETRRGEVSTNTVQRNIGAMRAFWGWLRERGHVAEDAPEPFSNLRFKSRRKEEARTKRQSFTPDEVAGLYAAALTRQDQQLADLILLAAFSGCRREEIVSLKIERVELKGDGGWIKVADAKTEAGNRTIPVHAKAAPVLRRVIAGRTSGYLFPSAAGDKFGVRGAGLGKQFTRLKTSLGYGPTHTFHSIRHTVSQLLRSHDVSEDLVADTLGHKHVTMTGGTYGSPEARRKLLPGALARLSYPRPL